MHDICHEMITRTVTGWFLMPTARQRRKIRSVVELANRVRGSPWNDEVVVENALTVGLRFLSEVLEERAAKRLQGGDAPPPQRARRRRPPQG